MKIVIEWDERKLDALYANLEQIMFDRQESGILHNSFVWGKDIFEAICAGDEQRLRSLAGKEIDFGGEVGVLAKDELRSWKNLIICYIANLTAKVLQEQLLDDEMAYSISDTCIQMVENARSVTEALQVPMTSSVLFCRCVRKKNAEYHPLAKHAKDYIYKHFHEKIVIQEMAEMLGTSSTYLGQVFLKSEGITLHEFILNEKIYRAKNLLRYSEYDMKMISEYLGFCSQSHFAREFKKQTGQTPSEYRKANNEVYRNKI